MNYLTDGKLNKFFRRIHKRKGITYTTYQILKKNEFDFVLTKPKLLSDEILNKNKGIDVIVEMDDNTVIKGKLGELDEYGNILSVYSDSEKFELPLNYMGKMVLLI